MAYFFGDGFDLYSTITDCGSYWDAAFGGGVTLALSATGRFAGSRGLSNASFSTTPYITKTSGVNDAVHHVSIAYQQTTTLTGTNVGIFFTLYDGATAQCTVVFRSDGALLLTSGNVLGTTLATYTGAVAAINTWYQFEIEVVISNTTGSISVRKNGNTSNDFTLGSLNTRASANNYANKIGLGNNSGVAQIADDFLWRSDASSVPWVGDIRCFTRMPAADSSVAWSRSGSVVPLTPLSPSAVGSVTLGQGRYQSFTPPCDGTIGTVVTSLNLANPGNVKCSIFASSANLPTTPLGSATPLSSLPSGSNTFTFGTPVAVTRGTQYWVGFDSDTAVTNGWSTTVSATSGLAATVPYASFPTANPTTGTIAAVIFTANVTPVPLSNAAFVADIQQDAAASYVYSATVSQSDLYTLQSIGSTPASIVGVTTRGYLQKSDAGTRNAAVQLQSGATNVQSGSGATPTTWNPADVATTTISGSNLVATCNATGSGARGIASLSSGKYYWENTYTTINTNGLSVGIALASANLISPSTGAAYVSRIAGGITVNGIGSGSSLGIINTGNVIGIAIDFTAQLIWFRNGAAGQWNGSGTANPATGAGGISISAISSGPLYPLMAGGTSDAITANFGGSAFSGTVPSGFTAGFTGGAGTALNTTWGWLYRNDTVDPATGAAWTATGVNNATIGAIVTA